MKKFSEFINEGLSLDKGLKLKISKKLDLTSIGKGDENELLIKNKKILLSVRGGEASARELLYFLQINHSNKEIRTWIDWWDKFDPMATIEDVEGNYTSFDMIIDEADDVLSKEGIFS